MKFFTDEDIELPTAGRIILAVVGAAAAIITMYMMYRPSMALHYMDINNTNSVSKEELMRWIEQQKNAGASNPQPSNPQSAPRANTSSGNVGYIYFNCKKCGKRLRAPTGKGNIDVTCPMCKYKFDTRT